MLTAPLTSAALLKLTGRPSITKWRIQPVKGLPGAKCGVSRDSEERKKSKIATEAFQAQIILHGKNIHSNCSHQDDTCIKNGIQLFTNFLRRRICFWTCGNYKVLFAMSVTIKFLICFSCLPRLQFASYTKSLSAKFSGSTYAFWGFTGAPFILSFAEKGGGWIFASILFLDLVNVSI